MQTNGLAAENISPDPLGNRPIRQQFQALPPSATDGNTVKEGYGPTAGSFHLPLLVSTVGWSINSLTLICNGTSTVFSMQFTLTILLQDGGGST